MKKTVQIITVPLDKKGWSKGDIINDGKFTSIGIYSSEGFGNWQPQQLLVISDDKIKEGDWYTWKDGTIRKSTRNNKPRPDCNGYRVVASYPQIEGTLPISKETVQAWIDAGTPKEGIVNLIEGHYILTTYDQNDIWVLFDVPRPVVDLQGNLILKFDKEEEEDYFDEDIYDAIIDFRKNHPEKTIIVESPVPTDEEIREKALSALKKEREVDDGEQLSAFEGRCLTTGFYQGYKQALKDLGHE
jgi:hypothetical protein